MEWHCPFTLPMQAATEDTQARQVYPKNLTIRCGAHRAFVYGETPTTKTAAFTAACKDPVREAQARDLMNKLVHPKILDEEFKYYQTFLDGMEIDPTPIILPCLLLLGPTPSASGQNKRVTTSPKITGEEGTGDTAAFGSGTIPRKQLWERKRLAYRPQLRAAQPGSWPTHRTKPAERQPSKLFWLPPFSRSLRPLKLTTSLDVCRWLPKGPRNRQRSTSSTRHTQSIKPSAFGPHGPLTFCPHYTIRWGRPTLLGT
jgi:hypothetical protein